MNKDKLILKTLILGEIFNIAPHRFQEVDLENHVLAKKFKISGEELKNNIDFLVETGLINRWPVKQDKERILELMLTEKGLDYLERKEVEKKQAETNNKTLKATIIIAIATALNVLITLFILISNLEKSNWAKPVSMIVLGTMIAGLSGILIKEIWYFLLLKKDGKRN
jgi:DNA-binding MarR family transcriptional regulator